MIRKIFHRFSTKDSLFLIYDNNEKGNEQYILKKLYFFILIDDRYLIDKSTS